MALDTCQNITASKNTSDRYQGDSRKATVNVFSGNVKDGSKT